MKNYIDKIFVPLPKQTVEFSPGFIMDIYSADGDTDTKKPVVMFLHAGSAYPDDPDAVSWATESASRGYFFVSIEYQLHDDPLARFDEIPQRKAVYKVWEALYYLKLNYYALGINLGKIFGIGRSAGAITILQAATALNNRADPYFLDSPLVDIIRLPKFTATATLSGAATPALIYQETLIDAGDSLNIYYHGMTDDLILYQAAIDTYNKQIEAGIASVFYSHDGTNLGFPDTGHDLGHLDEIVADLVPKFAALIQQ